MEPGDRLIKKQAKRQVWRQYPLGMLGLVYSNNKRRQLWPLSLAGLCLHWRCLSFLHGEKTVGEFVNTKALTLGDMSPRGYEFEKSLGDPLLLTLRSEKSYNCVGLSWRI